MEKPLRPHCPLCVAEHRVASMAPVEDGRWHPSAGCPGHGPPHAQGPSRCLGAAGAWGWTLSRQKIQSDPNGTALSNPSAKTGRYLGEAALNSPVMSSRVCKISSPSEDYVPMVRTPNPLTSQGFPLKAVTFQSDPDFPPVGRFDHYTLDLAAMQAEWLQNHGQMIG